MKGELKDVRENLEPKQTCVNLKERSKVIILTMTAEASTSTELMTL